MRAGSHYSDFKLVRNVSFKLAIAEAMPVNCRFKGAGPKCHIIVAVYNLNLKFFEKI